MTSFIASPRRSPHDKTMHIKEALQPGQHIFYDGSIVVYKDVPDDVWLESQSGGVMLLGEAGNDVRIRAMGLLPRYKDIDPRTSVLAPRQIGDNYFVESRGRMKLGMVGFNGFAKTLDTIAFDRTDGQNTFIAGKSIHGHVLGKDSLAEALEHVWMEPRSFVNERNGKLIQTTGRIGPRCVIRAMRSFRARYIAEETSVIAETIKLHEAQKNNDLIAHLWAAIDILGEGSLVQAPHIECEQRETKTSFVLDHPRIPVKLWKPVHSSGYSPQ